MSDRTPPKWTARDIVLDGVGRPGIDQERGLPTQTIMVAIVLGALNVGIATLGGLLHINHRLGVPLGCVVAALELSCLSALMWRRGRLSMLWLVAGIALVLIVTGMVFFVALIFSYRQTG